MADGVMAPARSKVQRNGKMVLNRTVLNKHLKWPEFFVELADGYSS
jgi:hypothetical protein